MKKVKLFYSYSHKDESYREELEKHLATLRNSGLIDEWDDRKIDAGEDWDDEIEKNMEAADIILLLFSQDFIASKSCLKEVQTAMRLKNEKNTIFIPIILKGCTWTDVDGISNVQALPKDGKAIKKWPDQEDGWLDVYNGIKKVINKIKIKQKPIIDEEFKEDLLRNPLENCSLEKLFVYPDILKANSGLKQKLENNEIDSVKLKIPNEFIDSYILLEGDEQSGKTSLCNMLFIEYLKIGFFPVLIKGENISGKSDLEKISGIQFKHQYQSSIEYQSIDKEKRILLIDDVEVWNANETNLANFVATIPKYFAFAIVFIDKVTSLSNKSSEHDYFASFQQYTIRHLGHKKRNQLIKKCISLDESMPFDSTNNEHLARLDKDTNHINTIIGANIVPSNPLFIVTIFHTVEAATTQDLTQTSYGHCYHAMITFNLGRAGMKGEDIEACFTFLTELSYYMFQADSKDISKDELDIFWNLYEEEYVVQKNIINLLLKACVLNEKNNTFSFQYIYIYYYFVAKHLAQNPDDKIVESKISDMLSNVHKKDNANIIIFLTHHSNSKDLIEKITINAMSTFERFKEANLSGCEKDFIKLLSENVNINKLPDTNHDIEKERDVKLNKHDEVAPIIEHIESAQEEDHDPLSIEIRKSAKNVEIIGQVLKNQYGSLKKPQLESLFEEAQNAGLRLLKSFIELMEHEWEVIEDLIKTRLEQISKEKGKELSSEEKEKISQKMIAQFSYSVIYGWLHKIADSLGYDKLIEIADRVNAKTNTVASKLINLSIHTWHDKSLNLDTIKKLHHDFYNEKNHQAIHILKDIVSRHIYMHPTDYKEKQQIDSLLGFSVKNQMSVQQQIKPNHSIK